MTRAETYPLTMGIEVCCRILGVKPAAMLRAAGLAALPAGDAIVRVTAAQFFDAWIALERLADRPDMAVFLGKAIANGPVVPVFFALSCAPNLATGSARLARYKRLIGPAQMRIIETREALRTEFDCGEPSLELPASLAALHLAFAVEKVRGLTAQHLCPVEATLKAPETERAKLAGHLGIMPEYADVPSLTWSADDARRPFIAENARLWNDFERDLERQLAAEAAASTMLARVEAALIELLPTGRAGVEDICSVIGVSRSTLQRRLRDENTSYQAVLDSTRQSLALRYLIKSTLSVEEISTLLGYIDPNSFSRSFRRWTGQSPIDVRKRG